MLRSSLLWPPWTTDSLECCKKHHDLFWSIAFSEFAVAVVYQAQNSLSSTLALWGSTTEIETSKTKSACRPQRPSQEHSWCHLVSILVVDLQRMLKRDWLCPLDDCCDQVSLDLNITLAVNLLCFIVFSSQPRNMLLHTAFTELHFTSKKHKAMQISPIALNFGFDFRWTNSILQRVLLEVKWNCLAKNEGCIYQGFFVVRVDSKAEGRSY